MSKRIFTREQVKELLKNPNALQCSEKSITYHKDFKMRAVKHHQEGLPPSLIFMQAGFNLASVGRSTPKRCLEKWRKIVRQKGPTGFARETRGGPGQKKVSTKDMSGQERLKYYEAQITYLKAENAFLARLRKQR